MSVARLAVEPPVVGVDAQLYLAYLRTSLAVVLREVADGGRCDFLAAWRGVYDGVVGSVGCGVERDVGRLCDADWVVDPALSSGASGVLCGESRGEVGGSIKVDGGIEVSANGEGERVGLSRRECVRVESQVSNEECSARGNSEWTGCDAYQNGISGEGSREDVKHPKLAVGCLQGETKCERNRRWAGERKQRKLRKQGIARGDWRVKEVAVVEAEKHPNGFWGSCSDVVRQELIDSKACMHIAENKRKAREAEKRVAYLDSTQAVVDEVTRLVGKADEMAKKSNDVRVMGWAKTVTGSSAESLARSTPSSVPSFDTFDTEVEKNLLEQQRLKYESEIKAVNEEKDSMYEQLMVRIKELEVRPQVAVDRDFSVKVVRREGETAQQHFRRVQQFKETQKKIAVADTRGWF